MAYLTTLQYIAPPTLTDAMHQQRAVMPDDADVIDRLFAYLERTRPTVKEIRTAVCEFYDIEPTDLISKKLKAEIVLARQIYYYLVYKYTYLSGSQIARQFGHCDHTTVHHGIRKIEQLAITRAIVRDDLDLLRLKICEKLMRRPERGASC